MFTADNITIKIRSKEIVKDASLHIPEATVAIFIGSNGSGKTTTIRGITGLIPLASGKSSLSGENRRKKLGLSIGAEYLPHQMRVCDFLSFTHDKSLTDFSNTLLDSCGMSPYTKRPIGKLSMGMKQKISICSALRYQPENIILDEPHNGLDPESIGWLNTVIQDQKKQGSSLLISSHLLKEVSDVGDMAYRIQDKKISHTPWPPPQNKEALQNQLIIEVEEALRFAGFLENFGVPHQVIDERRLEITWNVRDVLRLGREREFFIENIIWK